MDNEQSTDHPNLNEPQETMAPPAPPQQVWPPQPNVWPPPASNVQEVPTFFPFTYVHELAEGCLSDFREGSIGISSSGLVIQGRMIPRAEIYQTVLVLAFFLCRGFGSIVAYYVMRYGCLRNEICYIPWEMLQKVITVPKKNKLCVVYYAPRYNGEIVTFSLTMKLKPDYYQSYIDILSANAPLVIKTGRIRAATGIIYWVVVGFIVLCLAIAAFVANFPNHV